MQFPRRKPVSFQSLRELLSGFRIIKGLEAELADTFNLSESFYPVSGRGGFRLNVQVLLSISQRASIRFQVPARAANPYQARSFNLSESFYPVSGQRSVDLAVRQGPFNLSESFYPVSGPMPDLNQPSLKAFQSLRELLSGFRTPRFAATGEGFPFNLSESFYPVSGVATEINAFPSNPFNLSESFYPVSGAASQRPSCKPDSGDDCAGRFFRLLLDTRLLGFRD